MSGPHLPIGGCFRIRSSANTRPVPETLRPSSVQNQAPSPRDGTYAYKNCLGMCADCAAVNLCENTAISYANFATTVRAANDSIKRETPLKSMLIPTSVPITHGVLEGQLLQIRMARIRVMIPSKRSQRDPGMGRSRNDNINSRIASAIR